MPDYLTGLADFLANTRFERLPQSVLAHARLVFMDTVGVIIGGSREPESSRLLESLRSLSGAGSATVLSAGLPCLDPAWAAFVNGTAGVFLELDEGHRPTGHPAIHVVPAPLALAEHLHASGRDLLAAIICAYEVPARLSAGWRMRPGVHPHGNMGNPGAAAACGRLLGFDAGQQREALNVATTLSLASSWLPCLEGATVRNAYTGVSGFVGIAAAHMVKSGFTGLRDAPPDVFGNLIGSEFESQRLLEGVGETFEITRGYFKFHACCAHNHPTLDAVLDAVAKGGPDPAEVESVEVCTLTPYARLTNAHPGNQLSAKFATPYAVAATIVRGSSFVESFQPAALARQEIHDLADRVRMVADEEMASRWPEQAAARVAIRLRDGRVLEGRCENPHGHYANPASPEEIREKFARLTSHVFGSQTAEAAQILENLDCYADVSAMMGGLRRLAAT